MIGIPAAVCAQPNNFLQRTLPHMKPFASQADVNAKKVRFQRLSKNCRAFAAECGRELWQEIA
jgi:hypothetical protein